jgi:hypothetical protein
MTDSPDAVPNTTSGQKTNDHRKKLRNDGWRRVVGRVNRQQAHERNIKKNQESPADKAARRTAEATVVLARVTVVLAILSALTLWQIYEGGIDTHALADAANRQVCAAEKSAKAARDFADTADEINSGIQDAVRKLNIQAQKLGETAKQTADLASNTKEANKISQTALEIQTRPWIGIKLTDFKIDPREATKGTNFDYLLKNYGTSPALHVWSEFQSAPHLFIPVKDPSDLQVCKNAREQLMDRRNIQRVIFPTSDPPKENKKVQNLGGAGYNILGCVAYQGMSGKDIYYTAVEMVLIIDGAPDGSYIVKDSEVRYFQAN